MPDLKSDIDQFASHFEDLLGAVASVQQTVYARRFRKNLLVSIVDSLARCAYPKRGSRDRFTQFVANFCDWRDRDRVSLPHLDRLLTRVTNPEFSQLRQFARDEMCSWPVGSIISIDRDPEIADLRRRWPSGSERMKPPADLSADSISHLHLLYQYRNSLLHEFREPGHSYDFADDENPHYITRGEPLDGASPARWPYVWLLHYPEPFFRSLVETGIRRLRTHLEAERINPYDSYVFGDYWLESLNR